MSYNNSGLFPLLSSYVQKRSVEHRVTERYVHSVDKRVKIFCCDVFNKFGFGDNQNRFLSVIYTEEE